MKIREANENDVLKVSRLWLQMVEELASDLTPNLDWWRNHATSFMKSGNYFMFVAESGGKILGFIDFFLFPEPATSKIHAIGQHFYVLKEYRHTGVSSKLWKRAIKNAKKNGAQLFELFCFEKEKKFWEHHGFLPKRILVRKERGCF